ncbi:MAG: hypothetical protein PUB52_12000 [Lachnospiraceae bacterium]|nr:hypothetical protein [Lachnospiraceae bacterium]
MPKETDGKAEFEELVSLKREEVPKETDGKAEFGLIQKNLSV